MKLQKMFIAFALLLSWSCQDENTGVSKTDSPVLKSSSFARGADVGYLQRMELDGAIFKDNDGTTKNCLDILKTHNIGAVRLRTWVNPTDGVYNAIGIGNFAKRCQDKGFRIMIDMHFGDTWNSVGKQNPPAAWAGKTYAETLVLMNDYVYHLMNVLKTKGVTPEWVQLGNETNIGICLPVGAVGKGAQMTGLLNKAYDRVKQVFPNCKTIIHVAGPQNSSAQNMLDVYKANGGKWDITGCSSYASLADQPAVQNKVVALRTRFNKPVMMVEVGGPLNKAKDTKTKIQQWIAGMQNNGGEGVFYWEPQAYTPYVTSDGHCWDPTTKQPTIALDGFK